MLRHRKVIDSRVHSDLIGMERKQIKRQLLSGYGPDAWYGDVWRITEKDNGMLLEGSKSDLVVFKEKEHSASGYVWDSKI